MRFLCVSLLLTGSGITVHAAPGIGVYPFLQTYVRPPMRQARPAKQGRRTIFLLTGEYSLTPACLHLTGLAFRKQKNIRIPGAGRPGTEGKEMSS